MRRFKTTFWKRLARCQLTITKYQVLIKVRLAVLRKAPRNHSWAKFFYIRANTPRQSLISKLWSSQTNMTLAQTMLICFRRLLQWRPLYQRRFSGLNLRKVGTLRITGVAIQVPVGNNSPHSHQP